jgi:hypothetical protein
LEFDVAGAIDGKSDPGSAPVAGGSIDPVAERRNGAVGSGQARGLRLRRAEDSGVGKKRVCGARGAGEGWG